LLDERFKVRVNEMGRAGGKQQGKGGKGNYAPRKSSKPKRWVTKKAKVKKGGHLVSVQGRSSKKTIQKKPKPNAQATSQTKKKRGGARAAGVLEVLKGGEKGSCHEEFIIKHHQKKKTIICKQTANRGDPWITIKEKPNRKIKVIQ